MEGERTKITPPQLAAKWGVATEKIVFFIRTGELRAIDASMRQGERPRYLIDLADVEAFEKRREVAAPKKYTRRPKAAVDINSGPFF